MTRDEKIALVTSVVTAYQNLFSEFNRLEVLVGQFRDDAPLWQALCKVSNVAMAAASAAIGDDGIDGWGNTWLVWYVFDNDCGERAYRACAGTWDKPVCTVADLIDLIEADNAQVGEE